MSTNPTDRIENPHRVVEPAPLLPRHELRPATLGAGVALAGLGFVFLLQQLGTVTMGAAPTVAVLVLAGAIALVGVAAGWARRPRPADGDADPRGTGPRES